MPSHRVATLLVILLLAAPASADPTAPIWAHLDGVAQEVAQVLSGRVRRSPEGTDLSGVTLQLWSSSGLPLATTTSGPNGRYRFDGVDTGTYYLSTRNDLGLLDEVYRGQPCDGPVSGERCDILGGQPLNVTAGTNHSGLDFNLVSLSHIEGTITDAETGAPIPFVDVTAWHPLGARESFSTSDENGHFVIGGLPPGMFQVTTRNFHGYVDEGYPDTPCSGICTPTGTPVSVPLAGSATADFALAPGGTITGRIIAANTGQPPPGGVVQVWNDRGAEAAVVFPDATGHYRMIGLHTGSFFLSTYTPGTQLIDELYDDIPCFIFGVQTCNPTTGTPVAVTQGETTRDVDFVLDPQGTIFGRVTDDSGAPAPGVGIFAADAAGVVVGFAATGPNGGYRLGSELIPGPYFLLTENANGLLDELYDDIPCRSFNTLGCNLTSGTPVPLAGGTTTQVNFVLQRGGSVSGRITSGITGLPLPFGLVHLWQGDRLMGVGRTDAAGFYQAIGLPTGTYTASTLLRFSADYRGELDQVFYGIPCALNEHLGCDPTVGTPIAVTAGQETAGIDFLLTGPGPSVCVPGTTHHCLQGGRFRVDAGFLGPNMGAPRLARTFPITADTGAFWFQRADNLELVVKVLDACASTGHFRVFAAGLTNLQVELVITDTVTGEKRTYYHPGGSPFPPIQDTRAFATCGAQGP